MFLSEIIALFAKKTFKTLVRRFFVADIFAVTKKKTKFAKRKTKTLYTPI